MIRNFIGNLSSVYSIDLSDDGRFLVSGGRDSIVWLYDIRSKE